jgi:hypothetical protein
VVQASHARCIAVHSESGLSGRLLRRHRSCRLERRIEVVVRSDRSHSWLESGYRISDDTAAGNAVVGHTVMSPGILIAAHFAKTIRTVSVQPFEQNRQK